MRYSRPKPLAGVRPSFNFKVPRPSGPTVYVPVVIIGEDVTLAEVFASSMTVFRPPAPSAIKLPARKKCPEALFPVREKVYRPCSEDMEYPAMVTARVAVEVGES